MTRQVVIERHSVTKDSIGQALDVWTTVRTGFAAISPISGQEISQAGALVSAVTLQVDMRYRPDVEVTAGMRVRYGARIFDIAAAMDLDTRHETLRLLCTEGQNQG